jgi:hypothetical protein
MLKIDLKKIQYGRLWTGLIWLMSSFYTLQNVRKYRTFHYAGLLEVQNILSAETGISRQNEVHSFGDHLISGSVNATPSSVIETSIVLCSVEKTA